MVTARIKIGTGNIRKFPLGTGLIESLGTRRYAQIYLIRDIEFAVYL
jgi:hypothetical protein